MKVHIDAHVCEGHGRCYILAPDVFAADEDGHGVVIADDLDTPELQAAAQLAIGNCPESAIRLITAQDS